MLEQAVIGPEDDLRILLVEDEEVSALRLQYVLEDGPFVFGRATTLAQTLGELASGGWDLVLLDLNLPDSLGEATFDAVNRAAPGLPVVILTHDEDIDTATKIIQGGAQDYLLKNGFDRTMFERVARYAVTRKRTEEDLRLERDFNRAVLETIESPVLVLDAKSNLKRFNAVCERLTGYREEEVVGSFPWDVFPNDLERELARTAFRETLAGKVPNNVECVWRSKSGEERRIVWITTVLEDESGAVSEVIATGRDVTEQRRAEAAILKVNRELKNQVDEQDRDLRESELRYQGIFNATFQLIGVLEPDGTILDINDTALNFVGVRREDVVGVKFWDTAWWDHSRELQEKLRRVVGEAARGAFGRMEVTHPGTDGNSHTVDFSITPVRDDSGAVRYLIPEGRDITDRKEIEERLMAATTLAEAASRAKSQFLATMSHELRTPLNAIIGFSDTMRSEILGPMGTPAYLEYADHVHESGRHLLEIINDILDVSVIEAGHLDLDLGIHRVEVLVEKSLRLVRGRAESRGVGIVVDFSDPPPRLEIDARRVRQVLLNLLSNAVKFTPEGGKVTITAHRTDASGFALSISDTGIGMDTEGLSIAFQPFGRVGGSLDGRFEGTGLGLPLSLGLMEAHDGTLMLESEPGVGTVATMIFPAERVVEEE